MNAVLRFILRGLLLMLLSRGGGARGAEEPAATVAASPRKQVHSVTQLQRLSASDFLGGIDFSLTGVITLVDRARELVVLQDAGGAVAIHFPFPEQPVRAGQQTTLIGANAHPGFMPYPAYPLRPAGREILPAFEFPMDEQTYRLSRIRGFLSPSVTGDYTFWIVSDNSSELWLSTSADPTKVRNIAAIPRFGWANPNEWTRYPGQVSEAIRLQANTRYYIEALHEQTSGGEHLAVAWQGPNFNRRIISAAHLQPWQDAGEAPRPATNGVLREFWTNFLTGDLTGMGGARPFEAILTTRQVQMQPPSAGEWPKPLPISLEQSLPTRDNFRWVQVEGFVTFQSTDDDCFNLELSNGSQQIPVRIAKSATASFRNQSNLWLRVQGVCEGISEQKGSITPGVIWTPAADLVTSLTTPPASGINPEPALPANSAASPALQGFYSTRGVVTFNDQVFGTDYLFIQENNAPAAVRLENESFRHQFAVGKLVDLGGAFDASQALPIITPLVVTDLGMHALPAPVPLTLGRPTQDLREGRWCELTGIVQALNPDGTLTLVGPQGPAYLWIGATPTNSLARLVDARLRARGVVLRNLLDRPLLLSPSRTFVEVQTEAPTNAFQLPRRRIAELRTETIEPSGHRVLVSGTITHRIGAAFFLQDDSGGIRVHTDAPLHLNIGTTVDVIAFPAPATFTPQLIRAQVRQTTPAAPVSPRALDLADPAASRQSGSLVQVDATLLTQRSDAAQMILELQKQQRIFTAALPLELGSVPALKPGSQLRVIGVYDDDGGGQLANDEPSVRSPALSPQLLLRTPADVIILRGPPWWTWQRTALLVGTLVFVLMIALAWVHLLRRRLERQQAAQLAFSRQVLQRLEDERRRIAVNLHDSLGQLLLLIKNQALLALHPATDEQGPQQRLQEISTVSSQAIEEVREITHGLRPYQLDRLGLTQAIRTSVEQTATNQPISFACRIEDVDGVFDQDSQIHVYRIVQEAVTNVVKHAQATEATVVVKRRPDTVWLSIRDNGRGFDATHRTAQPHELGYGLIGMGERARILGAKIEIVSQPGAGTSLTVEIPLPKAPHE